jgi:hypothetical protein
MGEQEFLPQHLCHRDNDISMAAIHQATESSIDRPPFTPPGQELLADDRSVPRCPQTVKHVPPHRLGHGGGRSRREVILPVVYPLGVPRRARTAAHASSPVRIDAERNPRIAAIGSQRGS